MYNFDGTYKKSEMIKNRFYLANLLVIGLVYSHEGLLRAFKPKWVNSILNKIGVNSIRLGGLYFNILNSEL